MKFRILAIVLCLLTVLQTPAFASSSGASGGGGGTATALDSVGANSITLGSDVVGLTMQPFSGMLKNIVNINSSATPSYPGDLFNISPNGTTSTSGNLYVNANDAPYGMCLLSPYGNITLNAGMANHEVFAINLPAGLTSDIFDVTTNGSGTPGDLFKMQASGACTLKLKSDAVGLSLYANPSQSANLILVYGTDGVTPVYGLDRFGNIYGTGDAYSQNSVRTNGYLQVGSSGAYANITSTNAKFGVPAIASAGLITGKRLIQFGPSHIGATTITVSGISGSCSTSGLGGSAITGERLTFPATTAGTTGSLAYIAHNGSGTGDVTAFALKPMFTQSCYVVDTSNVRVWIALTNVTGSGLWTTDTPGASTGDSGFGFRASTNASDTNWKFVTFNGSADTVTDTGVAFTASHLYLFEAWTDASTAYFRVIDLTAGTTGSVGSCTTTLPAGSTQLKPISILTTLANATKTENFGTTTVAD